jgi:hypothetical protein
MTSFYDKKNPYRTSVLEVLKTDYFFKLLDCKLLLVLLKKGVLGRAWRGWFWRAAKQSQSAEQRQTKTMIHAEV